MSGLCSLNLICLSKVIVLALHRATDYILSSSPEKKALVYTCVPEYLYYLYLSSEYDCEQSFKSKN